jgi:hypothetical protein
MFVVSISILAEVAIPAIPLSSSPHSTHAQISQRYPRCLWLG